MGGCPHQRGLGLHDPPGSGSLAPRQSSVLGWAGRPGDSVSEGDLQDRPLYPCILGGGMCPERPRRPALRTAGERSELPFPVKEQEWGLSESRPGQRGCVRSRVPRSTAPRAWLWHPGHLQGVVLSTEH